MMNNYLKVDMVVISYFKIKVLKSKHASKKCFRLITSKQNLSIHFLISLLACVDLVTCAFLFGIAIRVSFYLISFISYTINITLSIHLRKDSNWSMKFSNQAPKRRFERLQK